MQTEAQPTEMSLEDALKYAVQLHQDARFDAAETIYTRILEAVPDLPDALHFLGVLRHQRGKSEEAIALIRRAIELSPGHPDSYLNLGNVLAESNNFDAAVVAYEETLKLAPRNPGVYNNIGVIHKLRREWDLAESAYRKAIELAPDNASAYNNLGLLFAARGMIKEAVKYYCESITKMPGNPDSRRLLGTAYYTLGKTREAAEVFRQWLADSPDDPVARHMLAACSGEAVPDRAADAYVEYTFDKFANSFDEQLQQNLAYRAPEIVADAVREALPDIAPASLAILDAGCGTGLCGPLLRSLASQLDGVDLSGGMLTKASARQCYDKLEKGELTAYIAAHTAAWDVIVSADTLVYFGPIDAVCQAARTALRPAGLLVFTVEKLAAEDAPAGFRIQPHGRYAHDKDYVSATLATTGFTPRRIEEVHLRNEGGNPVMGWLVVASAD
ncbi:tetratricopeptide repeat protein [Viridibacterium curvum]|uniref:Tetratricopeptide repeat protein n=1 Tax=Viridibacterium curvum TaxID=1101404 RepID=A0ABP9QPM0_9RHOO